MINQNVYCVYVHIFFFLPSGLFDIVAPPVGPATFHNLIQKVKLTNVNKIQGEKTYPGTKSKENRVNCLNRVCLFARRMESEAYAYTPGLKPLEELTGMAKNRKMCGNSNKNLYMMS